MKNEKHGLSNTRIYREWAGMKARCYCRSSNKYQAYGGSGITVCSEWKTFTPFYRWAIANGYDDNLTLDRIDGNGNYEPSNCRWVSYKTQNNNRNINRNVEIDGEIKTVSEWCEIYGISPKTVFARIKKGWKPVEAITTKRLFEQKTIFIDINGQIKSASEWSKIYGISKDVVYYRIKKGWDCVEAVTTPSDGKHRKVGVADGKN